MWRLIPLIAVSLVASGARGQDRRIETLHGLEVVTTGICCGDMIEELGLSSSQLTTDIELKLRLAGMKVKRGSLEVCGCPASLTIEILVYDLSNDRLKGLAWSARIELEERVTTVKQPLKSLTAKTWTSQRLIGVQPKPVDSEHMRNRIRDLVDTFLNDWLAANPDRVGAGGRQ